MTIAGFIPDRVTGTSFITGTANGCTTFICGTFLTQIITGILLSVIVYVKILLLLPNMLDLSSTGRNRLAGINFTIVSPRMDSLIKFLVWLKGNKPNLLVTLQ